MKNLCKDYLERVKKAYELKGNNEIINILRKKEIRELENISKDIAKSFKKEIKSNINIKKNIKNGPEHVIQKREESIVNIEKKINLISKIFLLEYWGHVKEKDKNKEDNKNEDGEEDGSNNLISTIEEMKEQKLSS